MKAKVLSMLRENPGYISGQQICETLGVSRTAVWKVIEQLKTEGYQITAVRNKGYHLEDAPEIVTKAEIESRLDTVWAGRNTVCLAEVDSTNTRAGRLSEEGAPHGTLVVADKQTAGKGRRGRSWESPAGENVYFSLLLKPDITPDSAPQLTLVMALAVARAVRKAAGVPAMIKWPNDIIVDGRKVSGMLTEMRAEIGWIHHVVIGVGINVNTRHFPEELKDKATSLCLVSGKETSRADLIVQVMHEFEPLYEEFLEYGDLRGIWEEYNDLLVSKDREVVILSPDRSCRAYGLGINQKGELMVRKEDGTIENIFAGEVSVRGINGYV